MVKFFRTTVTRTTKSLALALLSGLLCVSALADTTPSDSTNLITPFEAVYYAYKWDDNLGSAKISLEEDGGATILRYEVQVDVGGKLAQLGSRIIDGFAKKMADQFFSNFQDALGTPSQEVAATAEAAPEQKKGWFRKLVKS